MVLEAVGELNIVFNCKEPTQGSNAKGSLQLVAAYLWALYPPGGRLRERVVRSLQPQYPPRPPVYHLLGFGAACDERRRVACAGHIARRTPFEIVCV